MNQDKTEGKSETTLTKQPGVTVMTSSMIQAVES